MTDFERIEFTDVDLIRARLADDGIKFPTFVDFAKYSEMAKPEMFNFMSLHGRQVYYVLSRNEYFLFSVHWKPQFSESLRYSKHQDKYLLRRSTDFNFIHQCFESVCRLLLSEFEN